MRKLASEELSDLPNVTHSLRKDRANSFLVLMTPTPLPLSYLGGLSIDPLRLSYLIA